MHITPTSAVNYSGVSSLGMSFGVQDQLVTGLFPTVTPYTTLAGATNMNGLGAAAATVVGAPTITNFGFTINTVGTDYVQTNLSDAIGDFTYLTAILNTAGTPGFIAAATYGPDASNGTNTASKGIMIQALTSTVFQFRDYEYVSGTPGTINTNCPCTTLPSSWHLFVVQRSTVGGTVTRQAWDATTTPALTAPGVQTSTNTPAPNLTNKFRLGTNQAGGGGTCNQPFSMLFQSAVGGGAALTLPQLVVLTGRVRTWLAQLPTPVVV